MLSTAIEKIQTLFSRHILLSSFYPLLIYAFINLSLLYQISPPFRRWLLDHELSASVTTLVQGSVVVLAIAVGAFFLSTISYFLRELVEGRHWPEELCKLAIPAHVERVEALDTAIEEASRRRFLLLKQLSGMRETLSAARAKGHRNHTNVCNYARSAPELTNVRKLQTRGLAVSSGDLLAAIKAIENALENNDADAQGEAATCAAILDRDDVSLDELLDYARSHAEQEIAELYSRRQLRYGDAPVLPTSAGNMVQAVASYAMQRYGFSIDLLWSRLQAVLPEGQYSTIRDAKAELDSLIALWWLNLATWIAWWFTSAAAGAVRVFFVVAVAGPLVASLLYFLILASYRGFHDLLRTAVDLHRFDLLESLHLRLPEGPTDEKRAWSSVAALARYGQDLPARYEHPK